MNAGNANSKALIRELFERTDRTFGEEMGLDLSKNTPSPLFRWLCAALLLSTRISKTNQLHLRLLNFVHDRLGAALPQRLRRDGRSVQLVCCSLPVRVRVRWMRRLISQKNISSARRCNRSRRPVRDFHWMPAGDHLCKVGVHGLLDALDTLFRFLPEFTNENLPLPSCTRTRCLSLGVIRANE